jgi:hypothetical protein
MYLFLFFVSLFRQFFKEIGQAIKDFARPTAWKPEEFCRFGPLQPQPAYSKATMRLRNTQLNL